MTAHSTDSTIPPRPARRSAGQNGDDTCPTSAADPPPACRCRTSPARTATAYRVDTYVNYVNNDATLSIRTPASGLTLKRVTIVVRDGATGTIMAREQSAFEGP